MRNTTGSRGDIRELDFPKEVVVFGTGTLALVNVNEHTELVVGVSGDDLGFLSGDISVSSTMRVRKERVMGVESYRW